MVDSALPETFARDGRPVCWLSLGSTIYLGPPLDLSGHARMVGALILGISGPVTITADGQSVRARSVFIPAQTVTETTETPDLVAACTFDPTATRVAHCTEGMHETINGLCTGHRNERSLVETCADDVFSPFEILRQLGVSPSDVAVNGQVEVPAGGQVKVPTPCGSSKLAGGSPFGAGRLSCGRSHRR